MIVVFRADEDWRALNVSSMFVARQLAMAYQMKHFASSSKCYSVTTLEKPGHEFAYESFYLAFRQTAPRFNREQP